MKLLYRSHRFVIAGVAFIAVLVLITGEVIVIDLIVVVDKSVVVFMWFEAMVEAIYPTGFSRKKASP
jgi:hypothetical protein